MYNNHLTSALVYQKLAATMKWSEPTFFHIIYTIFICVNLFILLFNPIVFAVTVVLRFCRLMKSTIIMNSNNIGFSINFGFCGGGGGGWFGWNVVCDVICRITFAIFSPYIMRDDVFGVEDSTIYTVSITLLTFVIYSID